MLYLSVLCRTKRSLDINFISTILTGVQGIQVEELWSLDQESFDQLKYARTHRYLGCILIN